MMNPFNPHFSREPDDFIVRSTQGVDILSKLEQYDMNDGQSYLVTGVRGSGKTVFLSNLKRRLTQSTDVIFITLNFKTSDVLSDFKRDLTYALKTRYNKTQRVFSDVKVTGLFAEASISKIQPSESKQIEQLLNQAKSLGLYVFICVDEIQATEETRRFYAQMNQYIQEGCDFVIITAGLPHDIESIKKMNAITFLKRSKTLRLDPFKMTSVTSHYMRQFEALGYSLPSDLVDRMSRITRGYAYAYQLVGYHVVEVVRENDGFDSLDFAAVESRVKDALFENVYDILWDSLTESQQAYLRAMADVMLDLDETSVTRKDLTQRCHLNVNSMGLFRDALIKYDVIYASGRGRVSFKLPYFREFLDHLDTDDYLTVDAIMAEYD